MARRFQVPEGFAPVTSLFSQFCEHHGLTVLALAAEKHGSWEWTCCEAGELDRFISLDITETLVSDSSDMLYETEVWAVAESTTRYTRQLVATVQLDERHFNHELFRDVSESRPNWFWLTLSKAWERVRGFAEEDLTGEFVVPRPRA